MATVKKTLRQPPDWTRLVGIEILPLCLALAFSVAWYFPFRHKLIGWVGDPYFNLWTLEQIWSRLSELGVLKIFSQDFWNTPIFYPAPDTLAFSENQILVGLLSWPLRVLTGNG